jgi:uncharacterized Tic20 family protein
MTSFEKRDDAAADATDAAETVDAVPPAPSVPPQSPSPSQSPSQPGPQPGAQGAGPQPPYPGVPGQPPYAGWQGQPGHPGQPPYPGQPGPGWQPYPGQPGPGWQPYPPQKSPTSVAMWAHLGALLTLTVGGTVCCIGPLLGWIAPVVIRNESQNRHDPFIRHHATQALNHAITQAIAMVLAVLLYIGVIASSAFADSSQSGWVAPVVVGSLLLALIGYGIAGFVFAIIGTTKANGGQWWSYPKMFAIPFVKP